MRVASGVCGLRGGVAVLIGVAASYDMSLLLGSSEPSSSCVLVAALDSTAAWPAMR